MGSFLRLLFQGIFCPEQRHFHPVHTAVLNGIGHILHRELGISAKFTVKQMGDQFFAGTISLVHIILCLLYRRFLQAFPFPGNRRQRFRSRFHNLSKGRANPFLNGPGIGRCSGTTVAGLDSLRRQTAIEGIGDSQNLACGKLFNADDYTQLDG